MSADETAAVQVSAGRPATAPRVTWLGLLGISMVLAALALFLLQVLPIGLPRSTAQIGEEAAALAAAAAEAQGLRLLEELRPLENEASTQARAAALIDAYSQWRQRTARLRAEPARAALEGFPSFATLMVRIAAFDARAAPLLAQDTAAAHLQEAIKSLKPALGAIDEPLHALAQDAAQQLTSQLEWRNRLLSWQPRLALILTAVLAALTAAFALIAWRQLQALELRRGALEELATRLRQAQHQTEATSHAKSSFLANMSHEIRTPIHGLMGMLALLRETGLSARQVDYLRTATESADQLQALFKDILDISQLESGDLQLAVSPANLRTLLRDVETLMRPQATLKSLVLHIDADPAVPERVLLDAARVRQILRNLLSKAINASERGAVVLDLRCGGAPSDAQARAHGAATLEFIVTDTGAGMVEATGQHLLKHSMQAHGSLQPRHNESGLGLEISRKLARLMHGDIVASGSPGQSSCFTFWMPLHPLPADEATPPAMRQAGAGSTRPLRVLVAEDHPINRQYLSALLESQGHLAHFCANGEQAVLAAREKVFDVVLMDVHMPVLDGIGATRAIRASSDPAHATVPIVALTADAFPETADRCMEAGMNDYLTKPVSPQGLATCLRRLFGVAAAPDAAGLASMPDRQSVASDEPHGQSLLDPSAMAQALQAMPMSELRSMIDDYLQQGPDTVQRLRAAIRDAQALDLRAHAHAAKGAALNLGLVGLAATAQALQVGADHLPAHEIARLVQRFEQQLLATRQALGPALELARARAAALDPSAHSAADYTMMGSGSSRMPKRP